MPPRISEYSLKRKGKRGKEEFIPDLNRWKEVCNLVAYDYQIFKAFRISKETFYAFIDKQRYEKEQGRKSEYLDVYIEGRDKTRKFALSNILNKAKNGDSACSIFVAKTYGELIENKDIKNIELKKYEVAFRTKQFLTELATKFELNFEELNEFANKYFKDVKLDDI